MAHEKDDEELLLAEESHNEASTFSAKEFDIQRKAWRQRLWISMITNVVLLVIAVLSYVQSMRPSESRSKHEIYSESS